MSKNKKPTILNCVEDLFKPFCNKHDEIEISENINPSFVMFIVAILGIAKTFILVIKDPVCPKCGSTLHRHDRVDFFLNKTIHMKKMKYKCSDEDCGCVVTPKWSRFIEAGCNYTIAVKEFALELGLICNISYERLSEIIYWTHGVKVSRTTLYKFKKEKFDEYVSKMREDLKKYREEFKIEFSNVLAYD